MNGKYSVANVLKKASAEYKQHGYIDLIKLIDNFGIPVFLNESPDNNFIARMNDDEDELEINGNLSTGLSRLKIAMEFSKLFSTDLTSESDIFSLATKLLLPDDMVYDYIKEKGMENSKIQMLEDSVIDEICTKYNVPRVVVTSRLKELGFLELFLNA